MLLVDPDQTTVPKLREDLEDAGHVVTVALTGSQALLFLGTASYDVVITESHLPDMRGIDVVKVARPRAEVIVVTERGSIDDAVTVMKSGCFEYVLKPFYNEEILHLLDRIDTVGNL